MSNHGERALPGDVARSVWRELAKVPVPLRFAVLGSAAAGVVGAVTGLAIGLRVNPPTAWFAVFEVALPAAFVGSMLGLVVGSIAHLVRGRHGKLPDH